MGVSETSKFGHNIFAQNDVFDKMTYFFQKDFYGTDPPVGDQDDPMGRNIQLMHNKMHSDTAASVGLLPLAAVIEEE